MNMGNEFAQVFLLVAMAAFIGAGLGTVTLWTQRFDYVLAILAAVGTCVLLCVLYFVFACFGPVPLQNADRNPITYALISTAFIAPGVFLYGSIPAAAGNLASQLVCLTMLRLNSPRTRSQQGPR
jgi:hypothetical protein